MADVTQTPEGPPEGKVLSQIPVSLRWVLPACIAWLVVAALLAFLQVPLGGALLLSMAVVTQTLSGMVVWTAVAESKRGQPRDAFELLGMGAAVGMAMAVLAGALTSLVLPGWPGWMAPSMAAAALWFWPGSRVRYANRWIWRRSSSIATAIGTLAGLAGILLNLQQYPLAWTGIWSGFHRDMLFFEALGTSIARYGPLDSIFMSGTEIRYHWLAYAWAGQLAETVGSAPFITLTRVLPVVALVAVMSLAASWASRLAKGWAIPTLAVLLISLGGYLGAINGTVLNFDSPSQALASAWLLALLLGFLVGLDKPESRLGILGVLVLLGFATMGVKVSAAAVGIAAIGLVTIVLTAKRDPRARGAWAMVAAVMCGMAGAFILMISGTATGGTLRVLSVTSRASYVQGLILDKSPLGIAAGTVSLVLAMAARWLGLLWLVGERLWRWRVETVMGVGLAVASVIPVVVLSEGVSETWFGLAASAPLSVLSAVGLGVAWSRVQSRVALVAALVAAIPVAVLVVFLWAQGEPASASARFWGPPIAYASAAVIGVLIAVLVRTTAPRLIVASAAALTILVAVASLARLLPLAAQGVPKIAYLTGPVGNVGTAIYLPEDGGGGPVPPALLEEAGLPPDRVSWSREFSDAGAFLAASTGPTDVVVTNDNTSFLVPALSGRLTYMSGAPYQWQYGRAGEIDSIPMRVQTSQRFTNQPTEADFATLCASGVTWMWVSRDMTNRGDWSPYATIVFENDSVILARLNTDQCP